MRFNDRNFDVNHQLNNIDQEFRKFLILNETRLTQYSAGFIRDFVLGKRISPDKIFSEYVESYYINSILPNKELARGTKKNYRKALNRLANFISFTKSQHLRVKDIYRSFAHRFKDYLLNEYLEQMKKGMTEVAAFGNLKKIITIVERALNESLIQRNPFKDLKLKNKSPHRKRLNISQLKKLFTEDLSAFPSLQVYRDIFLFSVFTGLAYKDAMSLKKRDLTSIKDNEIFLRIKIAKTEEATELILVSFAKEIMNRLQNFNETQIKGTVLPTRSNKELNIQIKIIAEKAGIPIRLTSHIARHTYRQLLSEAGIAEQWNTKPLCSNLIKTRFNIYLLYNQQACNHYDYQPPLSNSIILQNPPLLC